MLLHRLRKDDLQALLSSIVQSKKEKIEMSSLAYEQVSAWAMNAKLIDVQGILTAEGQLVATQDPYLETTVTAWLVHFNLSKNDALWEYFIYDFLPKNSTFSQDDLLNSCIQKFSSYSNGLEEAVVSMLESYSGSEILAKTQFLSQKNNLFSTNQPDLSNRYTTGYILAKVWERTFKKQNSTLVDKILDAEVNLSDILGVDSTRVREQLDLLEESEIIEQRSARPSPTGKKPPRKQRVDSSFQVYRCWDSATELLEQAYENDISTPNRPLIQSLENVLGDDDIPDFSQFLEWAVHLTLLDGNPKRKIRLAS